MDIADFNRRERERLGAPELDRGRDLDLTAAFGQDVHNRVARVRPDPDAQRVLPLPVPHIDRGIAQPERLDERLRPRAGIRAELDPDPAELQQPRVVIPQVGFPDIEKQVARLLDPDIEAYVTVSRRHRSPGIPAGRVPGDVVFFERLEGIVSFRGITGCG